MDAVIRTARMLAATASVRSVIEKLCQIFDLNIFRPKKIHPADSEYSNVVMHYRFQNYWSSRSVSRCCFLWESCSFIMDYVYLKNDEILLKVFISHNDNFFGQGSKVEILGLVLN